MAETKKIIHIETTTLSNVDNRQLGVLSNNDADLGFRMWGGKDGAGNVSLWLAKDEDARVDALTISDVSGSAGILQHNSSGLVSGNASINQLSDVTISAIADEQILVYNSTSGQWENSEFGIDELTDVTITTPTNGDLLIYNSTSGDWENDTLTLNGLSDVTISSPTNEQLLVYNSTSGQWENSTFSLSPTFDDVYDAEPSSVRTIDVDDEDILFDLTDTDQQVHIRMNGTFNHQCGFLVDAGVGNEYFRIQRRNIESIQYLFVESSEVYFALECDNFNLISSGDFYVAANLGSIYMSSGNLGIGATNASYDLNLVGRSVTIPLNESGNTTLSGSFTATSIIGALNELRALH